MNWCGYPEVTILLKDVTDSSENIVTDHIWFKNTKGLQKLGELKEGVKIKFNARASKYVKGYVNQRNYIDDREIDYKLNYPTKFEVLKNG